MPNKVINALRNSGLLGLWHGGEKGPGGGQPLWGTSRRKIIAPPPRDPKFRAKRGGADGWICMKTRAEYPVTSRCDETGPKALGRVWLGPRARHVDVEA
jgi:hypothetical protein